MYITNDTLITNQETAEQQAKGWRSMKLFEKIPASFFSILASPNRELYWTALVTLHHLLEYNLNIPIEDYCIALGDKLSEAYTAKPERLLQDPYLQDSRGGPLVYAEKSSSAGTGSPAGRVRYVFSDRKIVFAKRQIPNQTRLRSIPQACLIWPPWQSEKGHKAFGREAMEWIAGACGAPLTGL